MSAKKEFALVEHDAPPAFFVGDYSAPLSLVTESGFELVSFPFKDTDVFRGFSNWNDWKLFCLFSFALGDVRVAVV
jgi:hypothetical protein